MPTLNWDNFRQLPGAPNVNWEQLCRSVVRRSFGSLGTFREVAQQPGVEFHLEIERGSSTLGDPGRWWGWQCRWYDLQPGRQIGKNRRLSVEAAIRKTEEVLPQLTDWVLWTRRPLTPTDQEWFDGIASSMKLHLWNENDLDAHLVGDATILRETYFGDLILTPDTLRELRERSLAPVRTRWIPEVHLLVNPEAEIRKILGEADHWPEISALVRKLRASIKELNQAVQGIDKQLRSEFNALLEDIEYLCKNFAAVRTALTDNELGRATNESAIAWEPRFSIPRGRQLSRALRRARNPSSLAVQAALARHQDALKLYWFLWRYLTANLVAVIGSAGSGKTHLAASLTAARKGRPSGVYLEAWPLERRGTIDDLLRRLPSPPTSSFNDVLEAVEAAGERSGTRIPVVIDGLNESEDPANWKAELERLRVSLAGFRHVVVVVTVRPSTEEITLPSDLPRLVCEGFSTMTADAICRYFDFYRIDPGNLRRPLRRFSHPLFLRIFCESTNPDRTFRVNLNEIPVSLVAAFIGFRKVVADRIANRPGSVRRYVLDILNAVDTIAMSLWETGQRATTFDEIRRLIGDNSVDWTESLARALVDEGILSREPGSGSGERTGFLFDSLAGCMIADTLTGGMDQNDFQAWIRDDNTIARLGSDSQQAHPLASDIRRALVSMVPRRWSFLQLWQFLEGGLQTEAVIDAADLEGSLLDDATANEIGRVALLTPPNRYSDLFDRFYELHDTVDHPLNAEFLDQLLSGQTVSDRDLRWTEWVRRSADKLLQDVSELAKEWQERDQRTPEDSLRAIWLKWLLTSTVRSLRDQATMALYFYGKGDPRELFDLTLSSLNANDPYVSERMLAASYGIVMAAPGEWRSARDELAPFLAGLWVALCGSRATAPTDHWLIREYVEGIVEATRRYCPKALGNWKGGVQFTPSVWPEAILADDPRSKASPSLIDWHYFENYTIKQLTSGRFSSQDSNIGYPEVLSWINGRIWDLGWRPESFASSDEAIGMSLYDERTNAARTETYAKKYRWIGYYESAGRLQSEGRLTVDPEDGRLSSVDIDPSFPAVPPPLALALSEWLPSEPQDPQAWISGAQVTVPDSLLRTQSLVGHCGPWVALNGHLSKEDTEMGREVFGFLRGVLVPRAEEKRFRKALQRRDYPGNLWLPEPPEAFYLFAGEMPWSERVQRGWSKDDLRSLYSRTVEVADGQDVLVEIPAHNYSWESYHSSVNQAGGRCVPAMTFANSFDLRSVPASLDWSDPEGKRASITMSAPSDFNGGYVLYMREDLIRAYCDINDFSLVWIVWGEREVRLIERSVYPPSWLQGVYDDQSHIWRRVTSLDEIAAC